ncbi:hypothetical protein ACIRU3_45180 [Streptomyces sp. NPDC101151]|uniref:hypothetical protein n=1 Tax=Streptomyces sp. NPDC101151 TaxID=3366115 RepID=UPI00381EE77E
MTSFAPSRSQRLATAASALTAIAASVAVLLLALGVSLPTAWWPRTGQAFAADAAKAPTDACDRTAPPAKAYCERGRHATSAQSGRDAAAWKLLPAATAVGALAIWRRRTPTRQGRA